MNIKTLFLVCFSLTFFNIATFGQAKDKVAKVVIDAGHGGSKPGAIGKLCKEKDLNIKIARRVGKLISDNFDDVTVIYTRKGDETVEIYKRAEIANKNNADLFISIHHNSVENTNATGVETFVMGLDQTAASAAVAKKENADILLEKDYETNYSDFDPNSPEAHIVFSLYSSSYLNLSTILASRVQKHLVNNTKMIDRTVQQAGFFVLYKVAMPSILVELGFISNVDEEKYLLREDTQEVLALSIYNAFVEYKNLMEGTEKPYLPVPNVINPYTIIEMKETAATETLPETDTLLKAETLPETENVHEDETLPETDTLLKAETLPETENVHEDETLPETENVAQDQKIPEISNTIDAPQEHNIRFRVQFLTSKENINTSDKRFSSLSEVKKYNENNTWKYTSGDYKTFAEAQNKLKEVKNIYSDAFIVAFNQDRRITVPEALELLK